MLLGAFLGVSSDNAGVLTASAFSIVVLGGLGSVSGSLVAAYVVGYLETMTAYLVSPSVRTVPVLLLLAGISMLTAFLGLGVWAPVLQFGIAAIQVAIIAILFMRLKGPPSLKWIFAGTGIFWLMFLFGLSMTDYATRNGWPSIQPSPLHESALLSLATVCEMQNEPERALACIDRLVDANPGNEHFRLFRSRLYLALGRSQEAVAEARRAVEINPSAREYFLQLASALRAAGMEGDAAQAEQTAARLAKAWNGV